MTASPQAVMGAAADGLRAGPNGRLSMKAGSLCTGILGLDIAAHAVYGCELAWYSETEPAAISVIEREHPGVPNLGDLTSVDWRDVEPVDVLTAGWPCQPFSHAGKRKGSSDERHLWPYIADAVRVLRPSRLVGENVAGHLSLGFDWVLGDLAEAGFDAEWCVLRASDVGACHQRARLFVVATDSRGERHGGGQDAGAVGRVDRGDASEARERQRTREVAGDRGATTPADTTGNTGRVGDGDSGEALLQTPNSRSLNSPLAHPHGVAGPTPIAFSGGRGPVGEPRTEPGAERLHGVAWGNYAPAIARWELALGRPAPAPTDDQGRLDPSFVEWMMGYPEGWVEGLSRTQALKALGNAVMAQQGEAAIRLLEAALRSQEQAA